MASKRTTKKSTTTSSTAKTTKRTPAKRTSSARSASRSSVKTTAPVSKAAENTAPTTSSAATASNTNANKNASFKVRTPYIALIITILLLGAALYYFRGLFVAAVVNGQPISRLEVVRQTEAQSGKQTLDTLVRNALIEQKAKKENVSVTEKEINDEIKKLQDNLSKQGQNLDQVLQAQGMSQEDLKKLIRLDKLVAKMVGKDVKVTDAEINEYIEANQESLPQDADEATLKTQVSEQLKQQKTNEKVRNWLAEIQKEASVNYFVQY